jgi:hypothetical protein
MRRALARTAFFLAVFALTLALLLPGSLLIDWLFPMMPGPTGHYGGDRLFPGVLVMGLCVAFADRLTSAFFLACRLSDRRWSVFDHGPRRRRA